MTRRASKNTADERGATMFEFSLTIVVFVILTFGMLDIVRFLFIQALLTKGAQNGLAMAQEVYGFDPDLRLLANAAQPQYTTFVAARRKIADAASRLPLQTLLSPPDAAGLAPANCLACLTGFTAMDDVSRAGGYARINQGPLNAGVLRPGERAEDLQATADGLPLAKRYLCHPTILGRNIGAPRPCISPNPPPRLSENPNNDPFLDILQFNPIIVVVKAKIRPIVPWPFFPSAMNLQGKAAGFKEVLRLTTVTPDMGIPTLPIISTTTSTTTTVDPQGGGKGS